MRIDYFEDTDTLFLDLNEGPADSCVDFNDDVLLDLDASGNVVSITIEHASKVANLRRLITNISAVEKPAASPPPANPATRP
jgi:uncharacterized protein YuzE